MLYLLLYPLHTQFAFLNVFRYLSFRIIYAAITAFLIAFGLAPLVIRKLQSYGIGQKIRQEGPSRHQGKGGTPTMGGILILFAVLFATLLWSDLTNRYVWLAVFAMVGFGTVGLVDDYLKFARGKNLGLTAIQKFGAQALVALGIGGLLYFLPAYSTNLNVPFFKSVTPNLGALYIPFAVLVIVIEALSVIFQVASFKSRGKRVFLMAPIHHHFELKGWEEPKVVVRLWIIAILLALFSLSTLKLR